MGGREAEILLDGLPGSGGGPADGEARLRELVSSGGLILPTTVPGVGPFPRARGRWIGRPEAESGRRTAVSLYLALMADVALDLVGAGERVLVEGRFADDPVFVGALATLRPAQALYTSSGEDEVGHGALRLVNPSLAPPARLTVVEPLGVPLRGYRSRWLAEIAADPAVEAP